MDARRFDTLARSLTDSGTRRGLLGLLATMPVLGGLFALLDRDETDAKGRRKRRKKKHKHGRPRTHGKHKKKKCKPNSLTKTCTGKCGSVKNNCKKTVDCGSCGCATNAECGVDALCLEDGACQTCDVVCQGPPAECGSALQTALLDGGTIYVCPGAYRGGFSILKNTIVIGAGQGDDPTVDTILDGGQQDRVVMTNPGAPVTLRGLRVTGGKVTDDDGAGILNFGQLTMTDCTVTGNAGGSGGGIYNSPSANLTMTNCTISQNSAAVAAGGISLLQGMHTLTNCTFTGNTANFLGGALFCNNGGATTLIGCTIGPDNDAERGAIVVWNGSQVTLDATSVTGNSGTTVGGINNFSGAVTLQNGSEVSGNIPSNCSGAITGPGCAP